MIEIIEEMVLARGGRFTSKGRRGLATLEQRFKNRVAPDFATGCLNWIHPMRHEKGYGMMSVCGLVFGAHRLAFAFSGRRVPTGMVVMHKCDNPACCNPDHLTFGTNGDNIRDARNKGRLFYPSLRGEEHSQAKLTEEQVYEIKHSPLSGAALGEIFGVNKSTTCRIRRGELWPHVQ